MSARPRLALLVFLVALVATAALGVAPAGAAPYGEGFRVADAEGAAFPGPKAFWAGTCDLSDPTADVGAAPVDPMDCIDLGTAREDELAATPWTTPPSWRRTAVTQAGAHPDATATFWFARDPEDPSMVDGNVKLAEVALPAGFAGDPTAIPQCPSEALAATPSLCPPETQVGVATVVYSTIGSTQFSRTAVYNVEPRHGNVAEFSISQIGGFTNIPVTAKVRTDGDFGVTTLGQRLPSGLPVHATQLTLWGVPWASSHDRWRSRRGARIGPTTTQVGPDGLLLWGLPPEGLAPEYRESYDASWGPIRPFISNPTECTGAELTTTLTTNSWQHPERVLGYESPAPPVSECGATPFAPRISLTPTSPHPDSASGLSVDIEVPPNEDPPPALASNPDDASGAPAYWKSAAGRATSQLDKVVVRLPAGVAVNPSAATGLESCSNAQMGVTATGSPYLFDNEPPSCPDGSKIGVATATSPLLEGSPNLTGAVYLGTPESTDPQSGKMLRLFLALSSPERGLLAKIFGSAVADPQSGQLTATFDHNPRVAVQSIHVELTGGPRGTLAMPQRCGPATATATLTPWSAAHGGGGQPASLADTAVIAGDCSFGFAPALAAGMSSGQAGGTGAFSFAFSRRDGEQWLSELTATLPPGLLAKLAGVVTCPAAAAAAGECPGASRIGSVDASAGSGNPFVLERKGDVYLTGPYKGAPYGLMVRVPVEAGPFTGPLALPPIVVRQALFVDPVDAHVSVVSDPLPQIVAGIPLRVRSVTVRVDRSDFMRNPTNCDPKRIESALGGAGGALARPSAPFHAHGCERLPFAPGLSLRVLGKTRRNSKPRLRAVLTTAPGEANIARAQVNLPHSEFLEQGHIKTICTRVQFAQGEGHGSACPQGSVYGYAKAWTPLLAEPLEGPVYLRSSSHELPDLVAALGGQVEIELAGKVDSGPNEGIRNTFELVPDAPVSKFVLTMAGGRKGLLVNSENLCAKEAKTRAIVRLTAQNGAVHAFKPKVANACSTKKKSHAKRERTREGKAGSRP